VSNICRTRASRRGIVRLARIPAGPPNFGRPHADSWGKEGGVERDATCRLRVARTTAIRQVEFDGGRGAPTLRRFRVGKRRAWRRAHRCCDGGHAIRRDFARLVGFGPIYERFSIQIFKPASFHVIGEGALATKQSIAPRKERREKAWDCSLAELVHFRGRAFARTRGSSQLTLR